MQDVLASKEGADFVPSYVEVSFDSTCNFKCVYCLPEVSSRWWEEIEQHGPHTLPSGKRHNNLEWRRENNCVPIRHDEYNPYKEAFWKIWPTWYKQLHTFRVTGGEPLLSDDLWKVYKYIDENPNTELEFAVNSNLGVPDKLIQKLLAASASIQGKVKSYTLFTSLEATGPAAEYIRYGLGYQAFVDNVRQVLGAEQNGQPLVPRLTFMTTISALSYSTFSEFLRLVLGLRKEFNREPGRNRIGLSINFLRYPTFLDLRILPLSLRLAMTQEIEDLIASHSDNGRCDLFYLEEIDQLRRLIAYMRSDMPGVDTERADLKAFLRQNDQRRGTQVYDVFPYLLYTLPS
jgi:organic radical activating enzyme